MSLPEIPEYRVRRTSEPPVIDGRLDDGVWEQAEEIELLDTATGAQPAQRTSVRLLYDNKCLYLGFHAQDSYIWGTMTGHDDPIYDEEVVEAFIDPTGLLTSYYELEVSPLNTGFDALIINDTVPSGAAERGKRFQGFTGWDPAGFRHAVHVEGELGSRACSWWECEMAISFDDLFLGGRIPPRQGDVWRANLFRIDKDGDKLEESAFSPTGCADFHVPQRFGELVFC
jgi:Carbohydrate family 9 binding domain-like